MLPALFRFLCSKAPQPPPAPPSAPSPPKSKRSTFYLVASLQLAVHPPLQDSDVECLTEKEALAVQDHVARTNAEVVRAQGKLCLTFALRKQPGSNAEKLAIVQALEACIGGMFLEDYRRRIYLLGGTLANERVWEALQNGRVTPEDVAVGRF